MYNIGELKAKIVADNKDLLAKSRQSVKSLRTIQGEGRKTQSVVSGMFKGFTAAGVVTGLALITKRTISLSSEMQDLRVSIGTMLRSDVAGSRLVAGLRELAAVTPFTSRQLAGAAKSLLAFGFSGREVIPTLRVLGDVSAGTGKDIKELAVIFGQIKSAGRLMGQDLLQLINAGFNPLQVISEKTGRSMSDLKDDMSKGLITFADVEQAFRSTTEAGGSFYQLMEKRSKTFSGQLSTLKDEMDKLFQSVGDVVLPSLTKIVENLRKAAMSLNNVTAGKGTAGENAVVGVAGLTASIIAANLGGKAIGKGFTRTRGALGRFSQLPEAAMGPNFPQGKSQGLKAVAAGLRQLLNAIMLPLGKAGKVNAQIVAMFGGRLAMLGEALVLVRAGVGALTKALAFPVAAITTLVVGLSKWNDVFKELDSSLMESAIKPLGDFIVKLVEFNPVVRSLTTGFGHLKDAMGGLFDGLGNVGRSMMEKAWDALYGDLEFEGPGAGFAALAKRRGRQNKQKRADEAYDAGLPGRIAEFMSALEVSGTALLKSQLDSQMAARTARIDTDIRREMSQDFKVESVAGVIAKANAGVLGRMAALRKEFRGDRKRNAVIEELKAALGIQDQGPDALAGAFEQGSIEAFRILNRTGQDPVNKQVLNEARITNQILRKMANEGITFRDLGVQ